MVVRRLCHHWFRAVGYRFGFLSSVYSTQAEKSSSTPVHILVCLISINSLHLFRKHRLLPDEKELKEQHRETNKYIPLLRSIKVHTNFGNNIDYFFKLMLLDIRV